MDLDSVVDVSKNLSKYLGVGFHNVYVSSVEPNDGKPGQNPYVTVEFMNESEQIHSAFFTISEKAIYRLVGLAVCCDVEKTATLTVRQILDQIMSKWVEIELHEETYRGNMQVKLKNVHPCKKEGLKTDDWEGDKPGTSSQPEIPEVDIGASEKDDPF
jgi:hypothetical protein